MIGLIGTLLPVMPGCDLIFIGTVTYTLITNFQRPKTLIKDSSR